MGHQNISSHLCEGSTFYRPKQYCGVEEYSIKTHFSTTHANWVTDILSWKRADKVLNSAREIIFTKHLRVQELATKASYML